MEKHALPSRPLPHTTLASVVTVRVTGADSGAVLGPSPTVWRTSTLVCETPDLPIDLVATSRSTEKAVPWDYVAQFPLSIDTFGKNSMAEMSNFAHLLPPTWTKHVQLWLEDDIPSFDVGGFVVGETEETALLIGKSEGVLAGVPFFTEVFRSLGCQVEWLIHEGDEVKPNSVPGGKVPVAKVTGKCRQLLLGERTALNILTRASGVATQAQKSVKEARALGWNGYVAGTRKTTPGFRLVEKYALLVAGASTHRHDLSHMVMLKDNHVWVAGSITKAVHKARLAAGFSMKIEVECRCFEEAQEAAEAGADIVMLDNFEPEHLKATAAALKQQFSHLLIEASGGITPETLSLYVSPDVAIVSQGKLTQGYPCLDFSLKIQKADGVLKQ
ncbi:putative nicotinate-nucleotide pyrophosphorylase, aldolase-type TIM barrel [Plasmopara halstedii]